MKGSTESRVQVIGGNRKINRKWCGLGRGRGQVEEKAAR